MTVWTAAVWHHQLQSHSALNWKWQSKPSFKRLSRKGHAFLAWLLYKFYINELRCYTKMKHSCKMYIILFSPPQETGCICILTLLTQGIIGWGRRSHLASSNSPTIRVAPTTCHRYHWEKMFVGVYVIACGQWCLYLFPPLNPSPLMSTHISCQILCVPHRW